MSADASYSYCQCGCGGKAPLAKRNNKQKGWQQGKPLRFIHGHNNRQSCGHTISDNIENAYTVGDNGCWIWKRAISNKGYGFIWVNGTIILAHRHIWELLNGSIPPNMSLHHKCSNKRCINPAHLELVSCKQHSAKHPQAKKLNDKQISEIRRMYRSEINSQRQLAKMFGVSQRQIWRIVNNKS